MVAFAGNSLLCRLALAETNIDPASFTSVRIVSGAVTLALLVSVNSRRFTLEGNWFSAAALFVYAAAFSFAYVDLSAGAGALLLFGAVQTTMIAYGLFAGERLSWIQTLGVVMAVIGLLIMFLPGVTAPPLLAGLMMLGAGIAWGVYSLNGRATQNPTQATAGNFVLAIPMVLLLQATQWQNATWDVTGSLYALASGALASGAGYAVWYAVLPKLRATSAATIQLTVPAIAAIGGVIFLAEPITPQLVAASCAILGGVGIYIFSRSQET